HTAQFLELFGGRFFLGLFGRGGGRGRSHARAQSGRRNDDKHLHKGDQYSTGVGIFPRRDATRLDSLARVRRGKPRTITSVSFRASRRPGRRRPAWASSPDPRPVRWFLTPEA